MSIAHIIQDCKLTHTNAELIQQWDVSNFKSYHTGIDIIADKVYAISSGVVIELDEGTDGRYTITIQYNKDIVLRYMNLKSVYVRFGQIIPNGTLLGTADKYLHFEYATTSYSLWAVRISDLQFYKHDPYFIAIGDIVLPDSGLTDYDPYAIAHQTVF